MQARLSFLWHVVLLFISGMLHAYDFLGLLVADDHELERFASRLAAGFQELIACAHGFAIDLLYYVSFFQTLLSGLGIFGDFVQYDSAIFFTNSVGRKLFSAQGLQARA